MAKEKLEGIGGWLILFVIGLFLFIISLSFMTIFMILDKEIISSIILFLLFLLFLWQIILLFKKKRLFVLVSKTVFIVLVALGLIEIILSFIGIFDINSSAWLYDGVSGLVGSIIWLAYLYKSVRVKNTFVN